ncbi:MAG: 50S ribosomal protein L18 [Saprospiraceae bacterium]|nr:50S ribosomal protein L18 [Saprospiraceae bacterium]
MAFSKVQRRRKIKLGIKDKVRGTSEKPRLAVYRSNKALYCQLINDLTGETIISANTLDKEIKGEGNRCDLAKKTGELLAKRAKEINVEEVVFDRAGYLYHGRVKALAEGAREGGLKF